MMENIQNESQKITIRLRSGNSRLWGLGIIAFGVLLLLSSSKTSLTCSRIESHSCDFSFQSLSNGYTKIIPIDQLVAAIVITEIDPETNDELYALVLKTRNENIDMSTGSKNFSRQQGTAEGINTFIKDSNLASLSVVRGDWPWFYIIGILTAGLGFALSLLFGRFILIIDKDINLASLRSRSLIKPFLFRIPLDELVGAELQSSIRNRNPVYRIALVHKSSERLPLTPDYKANEAQQQGIVDRINNFLKNEYPQSN